MSTLLVEFKQRQPYKRTSIPEYSMLRQAVSLLLAGMVEAWVQKLVDGMQNTMKAVIKRAARNVNEMSLEDFLFSNPAQVALLGLQFQWTADTQVCSL